MPRRWEFAGLPSKPAVEPVRKAAAAPLRILILGDFSGRSDREEPGPPTDLASRALVNVDIDTLDAAINQLTPKLELTGPEPGTTLTIAFNQLDDFHPDALYRRLEIFQALRHIRARLLNPAHFSQAIAELSSAGIPVSIQVKPVAGPESVQIGPDAMEADQELFKRLLGRPSPNVNPARHLEAKGTALQSLIKAVVKAHVVHTDSQQAACLAAVDAAIGDQLRAILQQPAFQRLEARWRSVHGLLSNYDRDAMQVALFDVTRQELLADLRSAGGQPAATGAYMRLVEQGVRTAEGEPWSLLIGDYCFGPKSEDIALLAALGTLAIAAGGPLLAEAAPELLGATSVAALARPETWTPLPPWTMANWQALRQSSIASWLGLATPRVLLRLPYGRRTDPVDQIEFEEMPIGRNPEAYLWGNPAFVCARLIMAAFVEQGPSFCPGDVLEIGDLPAPVYEEAGEQVMQPATEVVLGERAMQAILAQGMMPVLGHRQRNVVRLARFQSLAEPTAALAGAWAT